MAILCRKCSAVSEINECIQTIIHFKNNVSAFSSVTAIRAAIRAGVTVCGENRVQELTAHLEEGAYEGAQVHFIGHLQTNKVKYVVGRVALIHSVSSEKLLRAIAQRADALGLVQDILLEINLAGEASKSGFAPQAACSAARRRCATAWGLQSKELSLILTAGPAPSFTSIFTVSPAVSPVRVTSIQKP